MPAFSSSTDVVLHIIKHLSESSVGHASKYVDEEHPGTGKRIEGWKWDQRLWPDNAELDATNYIPNAWDSTVTGLDESFYQSGYGDGDDLYLFDVEEFNSSGHESWAPEVNHGYFYIYDQEWYLYSDSYQSELLTSAQVSGVDSLQLKYDYKPTIPIKARRYQYNKSKSRYEVYQEAEKVIDLVSGSDLEFAIDDTTSPPSLQLNADWTKEVGTHIEIVSGVANGTLVSSILEQVGKADGTANQFFHLLYSPVASGMPIEVLTYSDSFAPYSWTIVDEFVTSGREVKLDYDLGTLEFGDYSTITLTGLGLIPEPSERVAVRYYPTFDITYEVDKTTDRVLATSANVNPVSAVTGKGFIQVGTSSIDPTDIFLYSSNLTGSTSLGYDIEVGNNVANLIAEVKNDAGDLLEAVDVNFEIIDLDVGSFGTSNNTYDGITDYQGKARAAWSAPTTISDVGSASVTMSGLAGKTYIEVDNLAVPSSVSGLYLYKVHYYDLPMGIPSSGLDTYYTNYLAEELVTSGETATLSWEKAHRSTFDIGEPVTYTEDGSQTQLKIGKKTIMMTSSRQVVNPHTGEFTTSGYAPLFPESITNIGTTSTPTLRVCYDTLLDEIGSGVDLASIPKSYFLVGSSIVKFRASMTNPSTGETVYSNTVSVDINIPDSLNGTYFSSLLSSVPSGLLTKTRDVDSLSDAAVNLTSGVSLSSGKTFNDYYLEERLDASEDYKTWFRRTRRGDTDGMSYTSFPLETIEVASGILSSAGEIPLGFRTRSSGITVASALDQITYVDLNDNLPSGYWPSGLASW